MRNNVYTWQKQLSITHKTLNKMNRAIKILDKMSDQLMTDIGEMANDYGIKSERTFEQQCEIVALIQFAERIETATGEMKHFQVKAKW